MLFGVVFVYAIMLPAINYNMFDLNIKGKGYDKNLILLKFKRLLKLQEQKVKRKLKLLKQLTALIN